MIGELDPSAEIYRPQLRYRLVNEGAYSDETLAALNSPVAELFRIEKSRGWGQIRDSLHRLQQSLPPADSLRMAFLSWLLKVILPRFGVSEEKVSEISSLEELDTMLAESIDRWNRELREKGRREGRQEGRQEGEALVVLRLLRLKFGPLAPEIEARVHSADADRLLEWSDRILTAESLEDVFRD